MKAGSLDAPLSPQRFYRLRSQTHTRNLRACYFWPSGITSVDVLLWPTGDSKYLRRNSSSLWRASSSCSGMAIYRQPSAKAVNAEPLGACRALYFVKRIIRH